MRTTAILATMAMLAAAVASTAIAGDHGRDRDRGHGHQQASIRSADGFDHGMQAVPNNAGPQERAHGWRYFSHPEARRAVVISPQGDYYLSLGKGLRWVAGTQTQV
ncbi:hypothetical protein [Alicycliphilus denitrificans]|uniref:hypothetical protein n=1 Tax=Alicycliphilus denitrificans TaxID=179636 RepID=UPI003A807362